MMTLSLGVNGTIEINVFLPSTNASVNARVNINISFWHFISK